MQFPELIEEAFQKRLRKLEAQNKRVTVQERYQTGGPNSSTASSSLGGPYYRVKLIIDGQPVRWYYSEGNWRKS